MPKHTAYQPSDVEVVLRRGDWNDWDQAIDWLRREGKGDNELRADEVDHMVADFERTRDAGAEFSNDPGELYEEITTHTE